MLFIGVLKLEFFILFGLYSVFNKSFMNILFLLILGFFG